LNERLSREAIFQEDILEDFVTQAKVEQPVQYIQAGLAQSRQWLPIFYFARMAGLSNAQVAETVRGMKISQKGKKNILIERLSGKKTAFTKNVTRPARQIAVEISKGVISVPTTVKEVGSFASGLTAVKNTKALLGDLLLALSACRDLADEAEDGNALGAVYKAACRVDEIFFNEAK
jgi:hypothetical protein